MNWAQLKKDNCHGEPKLPTSELNRLIMTVGTFQSDGMCNFCTMKKCGAKPLEAKGVKQGKTRLPHNFMTLTLIIIHCRIKGQLRSF